ncbi:MAG: hypothetical protein ABIS23_03925 [Sphingomicrobium sp.]
MRKYLIGAAFLAALATPAVAQESSYKAGSMWTAARIDVEDGQFENYMDWLMRVWESNQAYSKAQGWLLDYNVLQSVNPRDGEPDLILITRFADYPSAAESERRTKILNERMKQDAHSAAAASGDRNKMRRQTGSILYRELVKR